MDNNQQFMITILFGLLAYTLILLGQQFRTRKLVAELETCKKEIKVLQSNVQTSLILNGLNEQILVLHQNELAKLQDSIDENHNTYCDRLELIQDGVARIHDREINTMEGECMGHGLDRESSAEIPTRDLSEGSELASTDYRIGSDLWKGGCGKNSTENDHENVGQI